MQRKRYVWRYVGLIAGAAVLFQASSCTLDAQSVASILVNALAGALQTALTTPTTATTTTSA